MRRRLTALISASALAAAGALAAITTEPAQASSPVPQADAASSVHFTAAGDFGSSATASGVLAGMAAAAPDFHLALGDLSYGPDGGEQAWCDLVHSQVGTTPFELITGNHESNGLNGNIDNFTSCLPNGLTGLVGTYGKEWYVDVPAANPVMRIIMISPALAFPGGTWQYTVGSPHYNWTANAIDSAHAADIPWVVVGMHEPCLAMTGANCSSGPDLNNLLVSKKVDLVLSGHVHMYARTKQLATSTACPVITPNTSKAACVRDADETMTQGGTVFATVGTGGEDQQAPQLNDPEAPYFATYSAQKAWGFLDVTADSGTLSASFDRTSGASLSDSFTIQRDVVDGPPTAAFTSSCTLLACSFNGSGSSDPGGGIASYAWTFGDGGTATGATPSHAYQDAGKLHRLADRHRQHGPDRHHQPPGAGHCGWWRGWAGCLLRRSTQHLRRGGQGRAGGCPGRGLGRRRPPGHVLRDRSLDRTDRRHRDDLAGDVHDERQHLLGLDEGADRRRPGQDHPDGHRGLSRPQGGPRRGGLLRGRSHPDLRRAHVRHGSIGARRSGHPRGRRAVGRVLLVGQVRRYDVVDGAGRRLRP